MVLTKCGAKEVKYSAIRSMVLEKKYGAKRSVVLRKKCSG